MKYLQTWLFVCHLIIMTSAKSGFLKLTKLRQRSSLKTKDNDTSEKSAIALENNQKNGKRLENETYLGEAMCFVNNNGIVYDLNDLANEESDYIIDTDSGVTSFNVCRNALNSCSNKASVISWKSKIDKNSCFSVSGNDTIISEFTLIESNKVNNSNSNESNGNITSTTTLIMKLPVGDVCKSDTTKNYITYIEFTCDEDSEAPVIIKNNININECENRIYMTTKSACPKYSIYAIWIKIQENKWLFGFIVIGGGVYLMLFGLKYFKTTEIIAGAGLSILIFMFIIFSNISVVLNTWQFWLILIISAAIGCLGGWLVSEICWLQQLVFSTLLGIVAGFIFYNLCFKFIWSNPNYVFWSVMCACIIGAAVFPKETIDLLTVTFVGSYAFIRGLSFWCGGFPDEKQVYELGANNEWKQMRDMLDGTVYAYIGGFFILCIFTIWFQFTYYYIDFKNRNSNKDDNKDDCEINNNDNEENEK